MISSILQHKSLFKAGPNWPGSRSGRPSPCPPQLGDVFSMFFSFFSTKKIPWKEKLAFSLAKFPHQYVISYNHHLTSLSDQHILMLSGAGWGGGGGWSPRLCSLHPVWPGHPHWPEVGSRSIILTAMAGVTPLLFEGAHLTGGNTRFCRDSSKCRDHAFFWGAIIKCTLWIILGFGSIVLPLQKKNLTQMCPFKFLDFSQN